MYRVPDASTPIGIFWPALHPSASLENYYGSVDLVAPVLRAPDWTNACDGYYVSSIDGGIPRVTYFSRNSARVAAAIDLILSKTGLVHAKPPQVLHPVQFASDYGGSELAFRRYLCDYAQVGLDLLTSDRVQAQRLVATYRWQTLPSGEDTRTHFEVTLMRVSATYRAWSAKHRSSFWAAFSFSGAGQTPWDHMLVNQILCYDQPVDASKSPAEISRIVADLGHDFDVPAGWRPG